MSSKNGTFWRNNFHSRKRAFVPSTARARYTSQEEEEEEEGKNRNNDHQTFTDINRNEALECITGNTLQDRIRNEDMRNICEMSQDVARWARIKRRGWRDHVNRRRITGLQKSHKMKN